MGAASKMQEDKDSRPPVLSLPQVRARPGERAEGAELPQPYGVGPVFDQGAPQDAASPLRRDRAGGGG